MKGGKIGMMNDFAIQILEDNSARLGIETESKVIIPLNAGEQCQLILKGSDVQRLITDIGTGRVHVEAINLNKL